MWCGTTQAQTDSFWRWAAWFLFSSLMLVLLTNTRTQTQTMNAFSRWQVNWQRHRAGSDLFNCTLKEEPRERPSERYSVHPYWWMGNIGVVGTPTVHLWHLAARDQAVRTRIGRILSLRTRPPYGAPSTTYTLKTDTTLKWQVELSLRINAVLKQS